MRSLLRASFLFSFFEPSWLDSIRFRYYNGNDQSEDWQVGFQNSSHLTLNNFLILFFLLWCTAGARLRSCWLFGAGPGRCLRLSGGAGCDVQEKARRGENARCEILIFVIQFFNFEVATLLFLQTFFLFVSGLAFAYDPDGYWVEIIQRGGISMLDV